MKRVKYVLQRDGMTLSIRSVSERLSLQLEQVK